MGRCGAVWWSVVSGPIDDEGFDAFVAHIREAASSPLPNRTVLDILHSTPMPTAARRRRLVTAIQEAPDAQSVLGHALVVNSNMGRALLTALNWFVAPRFPEQVFIQPTAACAWLGEMSPGVDPAALLKEIVQQCPELPRLAW